MELAVHLRGPEPQEDLSNLAQHLANYYDATLLSKENWFKNFPSTVNRIYIGDEFCSHRLPSLSELKALYQFAEKRGLGVTLLTPVLTDEGLSKHASLFDYLSERDPAAEVVVSDWGSLFFIKERYSHFQVAAGRLLNKGFKDPRLADPEKTASFSSEARALLYESTFDQRAFQEKLARLGIARIEKDLLPHGAFPGKDSSPPLKVSVYFPFGYITTGRVCWMASALQAVEEKFTPPRFCSRPCNDSTVELKGGAFALPLIQSGNTVFYRYRLSVVGSLFEAAQRKNVRLIYQGFAL